MMISTGTGQRRRQASGIAWAASNARASHSGCSCPWYGSTETMFTPARATASTASWTRSCCRGGSAATRAASPCGNPVIRAASLVTTRSYGAAAAWRIGRPAEPAGQPQGGTPPRDYGGRQLRAEARQMRDAPAWRGAAVAAVAMAAAAGLSGCAARAGASPSIELATAYVPVPQTPGTTVAYVVIRNNGAADRLVAARTSAGGRVTFRVARGPGASIMGTLTSVG